MSVVDDETESRAQPGVCILVEPLCTLHTRPAEQMDPTRDNRYLEDALVPLCFFLPCMYLLPCTYP